MIDEGSSDEITPDRAEKEARDCAASFLAFVQKTADAMGVPCDTVVATDAHPYDAIVNTANERGCDLIVMTSRCRKGLVSLIMSNESSRVLHRASIPVLVFRALMSADHPDRKLPDAGDKTHRQERAVVTWPGQDQLVSRMR